MEKDYLVTQLEKKYDEIISDYLENMDEIWEEYDIYLSEIRRLLNTKTEVKKYPVIQLKQKDV